MDHSWYTQNIASNKERGAVGMLEAKSLMVFHENALAVDNINMKGRAGEITGVFEAVCPTDSTDHSLRLYS